MPRKMSIFTSGIATSSCQTWRRGQQDLRVFWRFWLSLDGVGQVEGIEGQGNAREVAGFLRWAGHEKAGAKHKPGCKLPRYRSSS